MEIDVTATESMPHRAAYTIKEARQLLGGIAPATIYGLIRRGELRTFRVGRRRFVGADAIDEYIRTAERETEAA